MSEFFGSIADRGGTVSGNSLALLKGSGMEKKLEGGSDAGRSSFTAEGPGSVVSENEIGTPADLKATGGGKIKGNSTGPRPAARPSRLKNVAIVVGIIVALGGLGIKIYREYRQRPQEKHAAASP